jgi:hypothetical protein
MATIKKAKASAPIWSSELMELFPLRNNDRYDDFRSITYVPRSPVRSPPTVKTSRGIPMHPCRWVLRLEDLDAWRGKGMVFG